MAARAHHSGELPDRTRQALRVYRTCLTLREGSSVLRAVTMQYVRTLALALIASGAIVASVGDEARAQPAGLNVGRDCQVVRTCNFGRSGSYRGCLSSFTCRVCRFVPARCYVDGSQRVCQRMRCSWGG